MLVLDTLIGWWDEFGLDWIVLDSGMIWYVMHLRVGLHMRNRAHADGHGWKGGEPPQRY